MKTSTLIALCAVAAVPGVGFAETATTSLCANATETAAVRDFYAKTGPGKPPPIPSRNLEIIESKVVSALPATQAVGVSANAERFAEVWRSIDTWGANNTIGLVITVDGWHAFNFPSRVPVTQAKHHAGFYDAYADGGRSVIGHFNAERVSAIYAVRLPAKGGALLRAVSFYGPTGDLIVGLYASEPGKPENKEVIAGFDATWNLLAGLPSACGK